MSIIDVHFYSHFSYFADKKEKNFKPIKINSIIAFYNLNFWLLLFYFGLVYWAFPLNFDDTKCKIYSFKSNSSEESSTTTKSRTLSMSRGAAWSKLKNHLMIATVSKSIERCRRQFNCLKCFCGWMNFFSWVSCLCLDWGMTYYRRHNRISSRKDFKGKG